MKNEKSDKRLKTQGAKFVTSHNMLNLFWLLFLVNYSLFICNYAKGQGQNNEKSGWKLSSAKLKIQITAKDTTKILNDKGLMLNNKNMEKVSPLQNVKPIDKGVKTHSGELDEDSGTVKSEKLKVKSEKLIPNNEQRTTNYVLETVGNEANVYRLKLGVQSSEFGEESSEFREKGTTNYLKFKIYNNGNYTNHINYKKNKEEGWSLPSFVELKNILTVIVNSKDKDNLYNKFSWESKDSINILTDDKPHYNINNDYVVKCYEVFRKNNKFKENEISTGDNCYIILIKEEK